MDLCYIVRFGWQLKWQPFANWLQWNRTYTSFCVLIFFVFFFLNFYRRPLDVIEPRCCYVVVVAFFRQILIKLDILSIIQIFLSDRIWIIALKENCNCSLVKRHQMRKDFPKCVKNWNKRSQRRQTSKSIANEEKTRKKSDPNGRTKHFYCVHEFNPLLYI